MYRAAMDGPPPVKTVSLPGGDQGTKKTVDEMRRLIDEGSRDPQVRASVIRVLQSRVSGDHDVPGQVKAWFEYVRSIFFVNDPDGSEWLQSARVTLELSAGDCDDRAILLGAGLKSIGVPVQLKIVAVDPSRPQTFSHVLVVANVMGRPLALDPTFRGNAMGHEPYRPFRTWMVPA